MYGKGNKVCSYYLEGRCRFGDTCKFEHPKNQNQNRFAPLSNQPRGRSGAFGSNTQDAAETYPFAVKPDGIKIDLDDERPIWPLSSYGPGQHAPRQLLDAEFEQSPEEMRLLHYMAMANGNGHETAQRESSTAEAVNQAIQKILADLNGAVKYVIDGKDQHPNRIDMTKTPFGSQGATSAQTTTAFGAQGNTQTSTFGQPSSFGRNAQSTAFGQPSTPGQSTSFGQATPSNGTAFGQPSGLGQNSAFGKPSALGSTPAIGKPAFGQPSQPSGFGQAAQTPAFGQSGFATKTPFGAANTQASFGQPSAFGAAANKLSPFGATSTTQPSPFGAAASTTQSTPFGAAANAAQPSSFAAATNTAQPSPFAAATNTAQPSPFAAATSGAQPSSFTAATNGTQGQPTSTFGQPSAFGAASKPSPFAAATEGTQSQTTSTFGQPSAFGAASKPSPFAVAAAGTSSQHSSTGGSGQPSAFGAAAQSSSPFGGQPAVPSSSPFGQASQPQGSPFGSQSGPTAKPAQLSPFGNNQQNNTSGTTQQLGQHLKRDGAGKLTAFKGQPVSYDANKKTYTVQDPSTRRPHRIWFPDGPTSPHKDAQAPESSYEGDIGAALAKLYLYVKDHGVFENGVMPETPPKSEWIAFDI